MHALTGLLEVVLALDTHLAALASQVGDWLYVLLFGVVFCETGLVIAPFLPGDSLLFAGGTLAGAGILDPVVLAALLFAAAVLGDAANYAIGRAAGRQVTSGALGRLVPERHLRRTERFYERHGGKTIVLARFMPFARTFAPFVAGVSRMDLRRFLLFNVLGAGLWTAVFVGAGYFFGSVPWVREHLSIIVAAMILFSLLPAAWAAGAARLRHASGLEPAGEAGGSDTPESPRDPC